MAKMTRWALTDVHFAIPSFETDPWAVNNTGVPAGDLLPRLFYIERFFLVSR